MSIEKGILFAIFAMTIMCIVALILALCERPRSLSVDLSKIKFSIDCIPYILPGWELKRNNGDLRKNFGTINFWNYESGEKIWFNVDENDKIIKWSVKTTETKEREFLTLCRYDCPETVEEFLYTIHTLGIKIPVK